MAKKFKKASFSILVNACEKLKVDPRDLCEQIGYSRSTYDGWREDQSIPMVASIAIEGILRRHNVKRNVVLKGSFEVLSADTGIDTEEVAPGIWVLKL